MTNLPRPDFIERDPQAVETAAIALYEQTVDKTLYPAQPERLLLDVLAYRESLLRLGIQDAAEQNLVNYARGVNLDQLGALLGVTRLQPSKARCTLEFTKDLGVSSSLVVPEGTPVGVSGVDQLFATIADLTIPADDLSGTVIAESIAVGVAGNLLQPPAINDLVDPVPGIASAANITASKGGADLEGDDRLRARIKLAPNLFSVAGSVGAYLYFVLTSDQTVIDAAIIKGTIPFLMQVKIYPLTANGPASIEVRDRVQAILTDERVRPLTDAVQVIAPTTINYTIAANITLYSIADAATLQTQLNSAIAAFAAEKRAKLGQDIVRSQIIHALSLPGVYRVYLINPSVDIAIALNEWANATDTTATLIGASDG